VPSAAYEYQHLTTADYRHIDRIVERASADGVLGKSELNVKPGVNWVERKGGLPPYIVRIASDLLEKGMSMGHAIATAINAIKKACATGDLNWPGIQQENLGSRAQACAAVAQWEALKARA
jgi:hypothetical protein